MKPYKFFIFVLVVFSSTFFIHAQDSKKTKSKYEETVFKVNMSCQNCQAKIEKNIPWEKGVKDLKVDLEKKTVTVQYDQKKTTEANLEQAIKKLGFTCQKEEPEQKVSSM